MACMLQPSLPAGTLSTSVETGLAHGLSPGCQTTRTTPKIRREQSLCSAAVSWLRASLQGQTTDGLRGEGLPPLHPQANPGLALWGHSTATQSQGLRMERVHKNSTPRARTYTTTRSVERWSCYLSVQSLWGTASGGDRVFPTIIMYQQ